MSSPAERPQPSDPATSGWDWFQTEMKHDHLNRQTVLAEYSGLPASLVTLIINTDGDDIDEMQETFKAICQYKLNRAKRSVTKNTEPGFVKHYNSLSKSII